MANINMTEYFISMTMEVEKEFESLRFKIADVHDMKSYAKAAVQCECIRGLINGIVVMFNSLEDCYQNEMIQDMHEHWETMWEANCKILKCMKPQYWDEKEVKAQV